MENKASSVGDLKQLLSDLNAIVTDTNPIQDDCVESSQLSALLAPILGSKLPTHLKTPDIDHCWEFVKYTIEKLKDLCSGLKAAPPSFLLSVKETQNLTKILQLIVALGILPSLIRGVGLAPEKRSKFMQIVQNEEREELSIDEKYFRLVFVVKSFIELCTEAYLSSIIITKHLGDLLAALMQLSYAPLKKPNLDQAERSSSYLMTPEKYERFTTDQASFRTELESLIERVYPPTLVKFLLVIQSSGASKQRNVRGKPSNPWRSPQWLRLACGTLLSRCLVKKGGVLNVIRGVLDIGGGEASVNTDVTQLQKYTIVAQVLASPPAGKYRDLEEYYQHVCPQILEILSLEDSTESKSLHLVASACVKSISERSLILSRRYLINKLLQTFLSMTDYPQPDDQELCTKQKEFSEAEISASLTLIHRVFVTGNDPSAVFLIHLEPIILVLLELYCTLAFSASYLKPIVHEILHRYLKCASNVEAVQVLRAFAFRFLSALNDQFSSRIRFPLTNLKFRHGDDGGVKASVQEEESDESFYVTDDERSIVIVDMADAIDKKLPAAFFMALLRDLSDVMASNLDGSDVNKPPMDVSQVPLMAPSNSDESKNLEEKLLAFERELDETMSKLRRNLMVIRLLGLMSEDEKLQESLRKDSKQLLEFVCLTLRRGAESCGKLKDKRADDSDITSNMLEVQSLSMALNLLNVKVTSPDMSVSEWTQLQGILDDLKTLSGYPDERVSQLSGKLRTFIATHGVIIENKGNITKQCQKMTEATEKLQALTENLKNLKSDDSESRRTEYEEAVYCLSDPLLPIRGHGLIQLTRLIAERDQQTMENIASVVDIFKSNLEEEDTYLYLQAINGLVSCANHKPEEIILLLTREFAQVDDRKYLNKDKAMEVRTKIGEALVRVTKELQEMTPAYKTQLLNPFLSQMNHPDELVRASCLSNLGEVCKNLRFSLGSIVEEILHCIEQTLLLDKSIEVRRAAVLVVKLLLEGLGADTFRILQDNLRRLWKGLLYLRDTETDSAMQVLVNSAIEEVNKITKAFLNPDPSLKKNIYVLDAPPDPFK